MKVMTYLIYLFYLIISKGDRLRGDGKVFLEVLWEALLDVSHRHNPNIRMRQVSNSKIYRF